MSRDYVANEADLPEGTLPQLFFETVERFGDAPALGFHDGRRWVSISYRDAYDRVKAMALALHDMGLKPGDRAAILSENRPEWALADYACLCAGVRDVPIYTTLTASQVAYILRDSGARLVFVSSADQVEKVRQVRAECPALERMVLFDAEPGTADGFDAWSAVLARGSQLAAAKEDDEFRRTALGAGPHDVATILYTSGTTGDPKGVMLTHNNLFSNVEASSIVLQIGSVDSALSFLPLSHVLQRMVDYLLFSVGCQIWYARSIYTVEEDLKSVRPSVVVSVPRLYEKIYRGVMEVTGFRGQLIQWAREVGEAWADETLAGRKPGPVLRVVRALAERLVYRKIRAEVGGNLRLFVSGGAPLSPEINKFFYAIGLTILEGYGLTETSPVTNVNSWEHLRIGTVGRPVPGTEIRIADDGEILVRGPQVMKGYYNDAEATAESIDAEGWFSTGDVGEIDDDGFLRITDRKKDIIVTSGGKNIAPQAVENRLKTSAYVEQALMIGDRRHFPSLLLVPNFAKLEEWARAQGLSARSNDELIALPPVQDFFTQLVATSLKGLARYEIPKKIGLLPKAFSIEDGTLTPSLKVKRRIVERRYAELIESFYEEDARERTVFVA